MVPTLCAVRDPPKPNGDNATLLLPSTSSTNTGQPSPTARDQLRFEITGPAMFEDGKTSQTVQAQECSLRFPNPVRRLRRFKTVSPERVRCRDGFVDNRAVHSTAKNGHLSLRCKSTRPPATDALQPSVSRHTLTTATGPAGSGWAIGRGVAQDQRCQADELFRKNGAEVSDVQSVLVHRVWPPDPSPEFSP